MDAGDLLRTMLPMAATLEMMRLKGVPWEKIQAMAERHSQFIAEHGDNLLFLGPKKGDTSKAFTAFVQGISALAFVPGGVTIFGQHYEATHPDSLSKGAGRWLYHSTFAVDLPNIARHGLVPSDEGPDSGHPVLYLTGIIGEAVGHIRYAFDTIGSVSPGDPVLLRVHSLHVADVRQVASFSDDWFVERSIPAIFVQVWVPEKQAWIEVREAVDQGYFATDRRTYGSTLQDLLRYIEESWPKV